jgi:hypothetical protein
VKARGDEEEKQEKDERRIARRERFQESPSSLRRAVLTIITKDGDDGKKSSL